MYISGNSYNGADTGLIARGNLQGSSPLYVMEFEEISEGIRYLRNGMDTELPGIYYIDSECEKNTLESSKISSLFYILNPFGIPGEGWAGSCAYHLTNDSSGNTLDEMNFVR